MGERQREVSFRLATHSLGQFLPERDRERDGAAVAAGPAIGVGTEAVNAREKVGSHSDIAVPDEIEFDWSDLRP